MTFDEFRATLARDMPPDVSSAPVALWHDAKGDWTRAHETAQELDDTTGVWVHAYLNRKEGDASNAAYWYRHAGRPVANGTLDAEWAQIAAALLVQR